MQEQERSGILTEMPEGTGEEGLLGRGTVAAIREMRLRGMAKKAIARELGLDIKTVRKWSTVEWTFRRSQRPTFSAPSSRASARSSSLSPANARRRHAMPKRRAQFPHRYTTVHLNRDGVRVPFVRLSGRWLESLGFKEGTKFAAIGVEEGLLVLVVYEAAPDGPTSGRDASRALDAQDDALPPRNLE